MSKQQIYDRDGGKCFYCGVQLSIEEATEEHLLATVHGGGNKPENLTIACKEHNTLAGAKSIVKKIALRDALLHPDVTHKKRIVKISNMTIIEEMEPGTPNQ